MVKTPQEDAEKITALQQQQARIYETLRDVEKRHREQFGHLVDYSKLKPEDFSD